MTSGTRGISDRDVSLDGAWMFRRAGSGSESGSGSDRGESAVTGVIAAVLTAAVVAGEL